MGGERVILVSATDIAKHRLRDTPKPWPYTLWICEYFKALSERRGGEWKLPQS